VRSNAFVRFAAEAAFIILVAAIAGLVDSDPGPAAIIAVMAAALLAVAAEHVAATVWQRKTAAGGAPSVDADVAPAEREPVRPSDTLKPLEVPAAESEQEAKPRAKAPARSRLPRRFVTQSGRTRKPAAALGEVAEVPGTEDAGDEPRAEPADPALEPQPRPSSHRRWPGRRASRSMADRQRRPAPARRQEQPEFPLLEPSERLCETCGRRISRERLRAIPTTTQCSECRRADLEEPAEVAEEAGEPDAPALAELPREAVATRAEEASQDLTTAGSGREWNVWELERLARRLRARGSARDDEWTFLLVHLREFANPAGVLPADFDALVRRSFPELVAAVEEAGGNGRKAGV
jgi:DksA/TraR C4-type zinc finger protein